MSSEYCVQDIFYVQQLNFIWWMECENKFSHDNTPINKRTFDGIIDVFA